MAQKQRSLAGKVLAIGATVLLTAACAEGETKKLRDGTPAEGAKVHGEPASLSHHPLDPSYTFGSGDAALAAELAGRFPTFAADQGAVAFLHDGGDFYRAKFALIREAQQSIRLQTLIFRSDEAGFELADALLAAVRRGVHVQLIVDPVINYALEDQKLFLALQKGGVDIQGFDAGYGRLISPLFAGGSSMSLENLDDLFEKMFTEANQRFHEKLLLIDAERPDDALAVVGGTNFSNEYFDVEYQRPTMNWHDRDVMVKGAITSTMAASFDRAFAQMKATRPDDLFGGLLEGGAVVGELIQAVVGGDGSLARPARLDPKIIASLRQLAQGKPRLRWEPTAMRYVVSQPRQREDFIFPVYLDAIDGAADEILLSHSYLLPEPELIDALTRAARRGVDVTIVTNHKDINDVPQLNVVARSLYKDLLAVNTEPGVEGRIRIFEWGGHPNLGNGLGLNHAKYGVFDRGLTVVGSYNLDPRSRHLNSESVLVTSSPAVAAPFVEEFMGDLSPRLTIEISMADALAFNDPQGLKEQLEFNLAKFLTPYL